MRNVLDEIASVSGLGRSAVDGIIVKVRANLETLNTCQLHDFDPVSDKFGARHRCKNCGGEVDSIHSSWYRKGLEHAKGIAK